MDAFYEKGRTRKFLQLNKYKTYQKQEINNYVSKNKLRIILTLFLIPLLHFIKWKSHMKIEPMDGDTEGKFLALLGNLKSKKVFLTETFTPFTLYLYSFISQDGSLEKMRLVNLLLSCGVLINIAIIATVLHRIPSVVSFGIQYILAKNYYFKKESIHVSMDMLCCFAISCTIISFVYYKKAGGFKSWIYTCILLGLSVSIKKIGFITFFWILLNYIYEFLVQIQSDLSISKKKVWGYHFIMKFSTLLLIPTVIFIAPYYKLINDFDGNVQSVEISLMSPFFKSSLFRDVDISVPRLINSNDTVLIRHVGSLGGYLHSHPVNYQSGSREQQVTLFDYPDLNNEWLVIPASNKIREQVANDIDAERHLIKKMQHVLFQHKVTGKFLYASQNDKPPVNEKEIAHEISCRDWDEENQNAFKFKLEFENNEFTGEDEEFDSGNEFPFAVLPLDTKFNIMSVGPTKGCHVLSHDDRLPNWGFFQQEVLCVESANKDRGTFFVEHVTPISSHNFGEKSIPKISIWSMILEYLQRSWQKNYYDRYIEVDIKPATVLTNLSLWVIPQFQLGQEYKIFNIAIIVSLVLLLLVSPAILGWKLLTWNPIYEGVENYSMPVETFEFLEYTIVYSLGWLLHFYVFNYSKHPILFYKQYFPAFVFQILQNAIVLKYFIDCIRKRVFSS